LLPRYGHQVDAGRRPRPRPVEEGEAAEPQIVLLEARQSDVEVRTFGDRRDRAPGRRTADRRQTYRQAIWQSPISLGEDVVVYSATKPSTARAAASRHHFVVEAFIAEHITISCADRASRCRVHAGDAEGAGDVGRTRTRTDRDAAKIAEAIAASKISRRIYPGRARYPQAAL